MKTVNVGQKKNLKTKFTNDMEQKKLNEETNSRDIPTSTLHTKLDMSKQHLNKEIYSDPEIAPFRTINNEGKWIIALGNNRVSEKEFECEFDALEYISSKPWELILIGANVYRDICKEFKKINDKIAEKNGNN